MIVSTKGHYRIVYHNGGDHYAPDELLKAKDAIIKAGFTQLLRQTRRSVGGGI